MLSYLELIKSKKITWTFFSIADHCFLQSRTRLSSILWLLDNLPFNGLGSTAAGRTAFAPRLPIANFAVNWNCKALVRNSRATMATLIALHSLITMDCGALALSMMNQLTRMPNSCSCLSQKPSHGYISEIPPKKFPNKNQRCSWSSTWVSCQVYQGKTS